jgi:electron transport complex protein RnfB
MSPHVSDPAVVAFIDESRCIGCTLCIQACPVDAIVGAAKSMHTVIADACTGCELCIPPCPVDCIALLPAAPRDAKAMLAAAESARHRSARRSDRLARIEQERAAKAAADREREARRRKSATIAKVMERARQRLAARTARDAKR